MPLVKPKRSYRGPIEITANILEVAKSGSRKTRIMYLGNLSFELTQKYLKQLKDSQLIDIKESDGEKIYQLAPKGEQFLADYYELQKHTEIVDDKKRNLQRALKISP